MRARYLARPLHTFPRRASAAAWQNVSQFPSDREYCVTYHRAPASFVDKPLLVWYRARLLPLHSNKAVTDVTQQFKRHSYCTCRPAKLPVIQSSVAIARYCIRYADIFAYALFPAVSNAELVTNSELRYDMFLLFL